MGYPLVLAVYGEQMLLNFMIVGIPYNIFITAFLCMPMGLNNVIFPEAYGGDSGTGAQCCFVSQVLGLLTIPGVFALMGLWG